MMPPEALLLDIDRVWKSGGSPKVTIRILGSMALMLQTDYERGTKDGDILYAPPVDEAVKDQLLALGGRDTPLAKRHRVYVDVVANGLLMMPAQPDYVPLPGLSAKLRNFEVEALSILDVVITKLKPFRATDITDIAAMIERGHINHDELLVRFRSAIDRFADGATGAAKLSKIVENFNQVERDYFGVKETEIELPPWVDEG